MISYKSKYKQYWDIGILVLAFYNSIIIPRNACFFPMTQHSPILIFSNSIVDIIFIIDIILMFFTSVVDSNTGEECWDQTHVANKYISTARYKFDILSVFGAQFLSEYVSHRFKYFALFKLTRIFSVSDII